MRTIVWSLLREPVLTVAAITTLAFGLLAASAPAQEAPLVERSTHPQEPAPSDLPQFRDRVEVRLRGITVRVVDSYGNPIRDLAAADFRVRLGDLEIPIVAVDFVLSELPFPPLEGPVAAPQDNRADFDPSAKLVVFFFQTDFHPSRMRGQLRLQPEIKRLLQTLHWDDRVAVVSFDSHLKLWQDFTRDEALLENAFQQAIRTGEEPRLAPGRPPSLARFLDSDAARRAASPERALELTAGAMAPLPGEKLLIYVGWGLGRYTFGAVLMTPDYTEALRALGRARATVFALDVTDADYHSLEIGLQRVAFDTGGVYFRTKDFTGQVTARLARTISAHYVLSVEVPDSALGRRLEIDLLHKRGTLLFKEGSRLR